MKTYYVARMTDKKPTFETVARHNAMSSYGAIAMYTDGANFLRNSVEADGSKADFYQVGSGDLATIYRVKAAD